jgi:hypothetical protein
MAQFSLANDYNGTTTQEANSYLFSKTLNVIAQLRVVLLFAAAKNPFSSERHNFIFAVQALRVELSVVDFT